MPQIPQLASSPSSRLVMSFWDREISIWRVFRGPTSSYENADGQRHRLVGKVLIQGEENITSAMLSSDGKILVVATISDVKVFSVKRRKSDERGALRIQKLDIPSALSDDGARVVTVSPDSRWICIVRPNSDIYLARVKPTSSPQEKPQVLPQFTKLNRATRHSRHEKASHGTLGAFERTIRCVVFSDNSNILAVGDLSGCVDSWVLDNTAASKPTSQANGTADSDDESSDDEDEQPVIEGERWHLAATESPIPRLKAGVVLLSFRPQSPTDTKRLTNGTAHNSTEGRLLALTSDHQLVEFDALEGKLSDWSRRNPPAYLPAAFRGVKDRAMGCLWDLSEDRERIWLYGTSWLWMFDLKQDFPSPEEFEASEKAQEGNNSGKSQTPVKAQSTSTTQKRKRQQQEDGIENERKKPNTGAGDKIPLSQSDIYFDPKIRKTVGHDESLGEWISLEKERPRDTDGEDDDNDDDEAYTASNDASLARFRRRGNLGEDGEANATPRKNTKQITNGLVGDAPDTPASASKQVAAHTQNSQPPRWWHTYKYRDILGIVPLSPSSSSDEEFVAEDDGAASNLEVAVIERPMWDVELPGRYVRDYA